MSTTTTLPPRKLRLEATDVSGQKRARAIEVPMDANVSELVGGFTSRMRLPRNGRDGEPIEYQALLEREGRHLNGSELAGDVLENDDVLVLQPRIDAGACEGAE